MKLIFFSPIPTGLIEMLANESYSDKYQDTKLKTLINFIKEFEEFKYNTKNQLNGIRRKNLRRINT